MSYREDYMQYRTSTDRARPGPPEPPAHSPALSYRPRPQSPSQYLNDRPQSGNHDRPYTPATLSSYAPLNEPSPPYQSSASPPETYVADPAPYQEKPQRKPRLTERNKCCRYLCCACCLPVWARWILWIIIIGIIIVIIVFAVILSQFKVPSFEFNGVTNSPSGLSTFTVNGTSWDINGGLKIGIDNPNIESATLSDMNATAFYPTSPNTSVGGGFLAEQGVAANAITNFTFPFTIQYDPTQDKDQAILTDIATKCGLLGGQKQQLTIHYKITLAVKVLFVTVHPSISNTASFDCPITNGELPQLPSGVLSSLLPSSTSTASSDGSASG